jgi:hypothetical protein
MWTIQKGTAWRLLYCHSHSLGSCINRARNSSSVCCIDRWRRKERRGGMQTRVNNKQSELVLASRKTKISATTEREKAFCKVQLERRMELKRAYRYLSLKWRKKKASVHCWLTSMFAYRHEHLRQSYPGNCSRVPPCVLIVQVAGNRADGADACARILCVYYLWHTAFLVVGVPYGLALLYVNCSSYHGQLDVSSGSYV